MPSKSVLAYIVSLLWGVVLAPAQSALRLDANTVLETKLEPGASHPYALHLERGQSAEVIVRQMGVDVVVEVVSPAGKVLDSIDSPTGRNGDEVVEVIAQESGTYIIRVRPFDSQEPPGKYRLEVKHLRDIRTTEQMLAARRMARESAARWLRRHSVALASSGMLPPGMDAGPLDELATRVRVLGIGEATHGSREFGDLRLSVIRYLVEKHHYRVIALEGGASRMGLLEPYVKGEVDRSPEVTRLIESGWIGRRPQRELMEWLRTYNTRNPNDRVRLVGVDGQDNANSRTSLREFLTKAYGDKLLGRWTSIEPDLIAGDAQAQVFGDSGTDVATRELLVEIVAMLELDAPLLRARFGTAAYESARQASHSLLQAVDFNSDVKSAITHSRDWYMAVNVLGALEGDDTQTRAVFWAHNAHVVHPPGTTRTSGALLRDVLGCGYGALAVTFGEGAFVAQIPNDLEDRLAVSELPHSPEESVEGVLSQVHPDSTLVTWKCKTEMSELPEWFRQPHPMHWVGGLWKPGSASSEAFRPYTLLQDFDGIVYLRRVTADDMFSDRPLVPARKR
ncbi:MAG: erythromycin esterase family protein [Terriglobales bacterium]